MSRKLPNAIRTERDERTGRLDRRQPRGFHFAFFGDGMFFVRNGYTLAKCEHEPHTDNCMRCAPLWGVVAVKEQARKARAMSYAYTVGELGKAPTSSVTGFATRELMMAQIFSRYSLNMGELQQLCCDGHLYLRESPTSNKLSTRCITTHKVKP